MLEQTQPDKGFSIKNLYYFNLQLAPVIINYKNLRLTLIFSSHSSATSSIRSFSKPPPPLEQTKTLLVASFLHYHNLKKMDIIKSDGSRALNFLALLK